MKRQTSISLTDNAHALLNAISERLGVSRNAAMELAIREKATRDKISADQSQGAPTRKKPVSE